MPTTPIERACSTEFLPAYHNSGTRRLSDIYWTLIHDEEAPNARGSAAYFKSASSGGSAHLTVDVNECYRCLPNTAIPWGAASASQLEANTHGFHIELAGYAAWTGQEWEAHLQELKRAAYKTAVHLKLFKLPVRFVTADVLVSYGRGQIAIPRGVTTHNEVSAASRILDPANASRYSHSDPGGGFPRAHFMQLVQQYHG